MNTRAQLGQTLLRPFGVVALFQTLRHLSDGSGLDKKNRGGWLGDLLPCDGYENLYSQTLNISTTQMLHYTP